MRIENRTSLGLIAALIMAVAWLPGGCAPRPVPAPAGISLGPGRYVTASYRAPGFKAGRTSYALKPFTVQAAQGVAPETFQAQWQEALTRALQANGLQVDPKSATVLEGDVSRVAVRGVSLRFITGKITVALAVEGQISRGHEILFAFYDRFTVTSPVNPGPPAPKERELLLNLAASTATVHLMNELLLTGPPPTAGKFPQKPERRGGAAR